MGALALGPAVDKPAGSIGTLGHSALRHDLPTETVLQLLLHREIEFGTLPSTSSGDLGCEVEIFPSADCS